jgi:hypothetical protein
MTVNLTNLSNVGASGINMTNSSSNFTINNTSSGNLEISNNTDGSLTITNYTNSNCSIDNTGTGTLTVSCSGGQLTLNAGSLILFNQNIYAPSINCLFFINEVDKSLGVVNTANDPPDNVIFTDKGAFRVLGPIIVRNTVTGSYTGTNNSILFEQPSALFTPVQLRSDNLLARIILYPRDTTGSSGDTTLGITTGGNPMFQTGTSTSTSGLYLYTTSTRYLFLNYDDGVYRDDGQTLRFLQGSGSAGMQISANGSTSTPSAGDLSLVCNNLYVTVTSNAFSCTNSGLSVTTLALTGNAANMRFGGGNILYNTSLSKYKDNQRDINEFDEAFDTSLIYDLSPKAFESNLPADNGETMMGFVAEEARDVHEAFVERDENGELSGVKYGILVAPIIAEMKKLRDRITELENALELSLKKK